MVLNIKVSDTPFDLAVSFLTCYNSLLEPQLSDKEIKIAAKLLLSNIKFIEDGVKSIETRMDLITSRKTKEAIRRELDIKTGQELETYLSKLKKKEFFNTYLFKSVNKLEDLKEIHIKYVAVKIQNTGDPQREFYQEQLNPTAGEKDSEFVIQALKPEDVNPTNPVG